MTYGATKNACKRNAAKRFIAGLRRDHPKLKAVILLDGPASNGSQAGLPKANGQMFRFDWFENCNCEQTLEKTDRDIAVRRFRRRMEKILFDTFKNNGSAFERNIG